MKKALILFSAIVMFCSCYGPKKAAEQAHRAIDNYPVQTADIFRKVWPCDQVGPVTTDSSEFYALLDRLDSITALMEETPGNQPADYANTIRDTIKVLDENCMWECNEKIDYWKREIAKRDRALNDMKLAVKTSKPIRDTIRLVDRAAEFVLESRLADSAVKILGLEKDVTRLETKVQRKSWENWIWRVIALLFIVRWVWRKWDQFKTIKLQKV